MLGKPGALPLRYNRADVLEFEVMKDIGLHSL